MGYIYQFNCTKCTKVEGEVFYGINTSSENKNIGRIRELSYESNEELKPYIDKFFRDLNNHQIFISLNTSVLDTPIPFKSFTSFFI